MARVTDEEVKEIVDTNRDSCSPFISVANQLVTQHLASKITSNDTLLHDIELYLAAHFLTITEERGSLIRTGLGESAETYQDLYESGFSATRFGQQALVMDFTGTLKALSTASLKAVFRVL